MSSSLHNICVNESEIENTPSRSAGISKGTETLLRRYGCELIDDLGELLDLYANLPYHTFKALFFVIFII